MRNLTLNNALSQEIFNGTKKFSEFVSRPQQFNLREIVRGILLTGNVWLKDIASVNGSINNSRKNIERLSNSLEKIPYKNCLISHIDNEAFRFKNEQVLILSDGGDFQKPFAKKMDRVGFAVDGSNGHKAGNGYPAHVLMAYGVESKQIRPLTLSVFSSKSQDYKSDWDEQKKSFALLGKFIVESNKDRIVVEDRGCDDSKRFIYFTKEIGANFVTRILAGKRSRTVLVPDDHGRLASSSIQDLAIKIRPKAADSKNWWNNKIKQNLQSKIAFQKVFLKGHKDLPLYAIFCFSEGFKEPLVVLTSLKTIDTNSAWKHFFYYKKRWEVENFYRSIKQQFNAEKFLVMKFEKIQTLLFLLMIAYSILLQIKQKFAEICGTIYLIFKEYCKRHQRSGEHHLDILAFIRQEIEVSNYSTSFKFYSRRFKKVLYLMPKSQTRIFKFSEKW